MNAGRATPCARAPLPGADLGCQTFIRFQLISRCSIRNDAERTKGENRQEAKHGQIFPRLRPITALTPDQTVAVHQRASPNGGRTPPQWQGHMEAANTSATSIKSAGQTVLGSALGTVRPMKNPLTRPIRVESMSHEDADAENDSRCRNDLGHSLPPCLEMPGRAARMNWR